MRSSEDLSALSRNGIQVEDLMRIRAGCNISAVNSAGKLLIVLTIPLVKFRNLQEIQEMNLIKLIVVSSNVYMYGTYKTLMTVHYIISNHS